MFERKKLRNAIKANDRAAVCALVSNYPHLVTQRTEKYGPFPLTLALEVSSNDMVDTLIDCGVDIRQGRGSNGPNVLCDAVAYSRLDYLKAWGEKYPELLHQAPYGWSTLHIAASRGNVEAAVYLMSKGVDPLSRGDGKTPLMLAENKGHAELAAMLRPYQEAAAEKLRQQGMALHRSLTPAPADRNGWHKLDAHTIARVTESEALGYRLTDIFNLALGTCISIQRDLQTNRQTSVVIDLGQVSARADIETATAELLRQGGQLPQAPGLIGKR